MDDGHNGQPLRCGYGHTSYFGGCEECPYVDWPRDPIPATADDDRRDEGRALIRDMLAAMEAMTMNPHAALAAERARTFLSGDDGRPSTGIEAPENGETDPEWRAIRRSIDHFVGRIPTIGKYMAVHNVHITETVARLDASGDRAAADTIVWLCWYRALDRERERFLLAHARETTDDSTNDQDQH